MHTPHANQLREASRILRDEIPNPKVKRTVDVFHSLAALQRQILFHSDRMPVKRLMEINPR